MASFQRRVYQEELMDGNDFTFSEFKECLEQIQLINQFTDGYRPTLKALEQFAKLKPIDQPLRILDIGFGYGDTLRTIWRWAQQKGIWVQLAGVDMNSLCVQLAQENTPPEMRIQYFHANIFEFQSDEKYDVVINSLFMHHLSDTGIVEVLKWMTEHSGLGWFINDLHRHPVAYHFIHHVSRVFKLNRLIKNDAPLSVARAFSKQDWQSYLVQANLHDADIRWHWSFRYGVLFQNSESLSDG